MKKYLLIFMIICFMITGCQQNQSEENQTTNDASKILIAYYSYSGTTKGIAQEIQKQTDGDLLEIVRTEAYPDDFYDIAQKEIDDESQPEITLSIDSIDDYDTILIGYPLWWEEAPAMINTFVHQFDFSSKTVIPFCTSSRDGIEASLNVFDDIKDKANVQTGKRIESQSDVISWLKEINMTK